MPAQPNAVTSVPLQPQGNLSPSLTDASALTQFNKTNLPWSFGVGMSYSQAFPYATATTLNFDQLFFNTYRAPNTIYSLRTIAGGGKPYQQIILPQYGMYEFTWMTLFEFQGANLELDMFLTIGSVTFQAYYQMVYLSNPYGSGSISAQWLCNPGDAVYAQVRQQNTNTATSYTAGGGSGNNLIIRYLGVS